MKNIYVTVNKNEEIVVDIRDYGYNCGVKKLTVIPDKSSNIIEGTLVNNILVCDYGNRMVFPIIDNKSPCSFSFKAKEKTNLCIIIEELGGLPDPYYFGYYEPIPPTPKVPKYYVYINGRKAYIGTATINDDNTFTIKTWGENIKPYFASIPNRGYGTFNNSTKMQFYRGFAGSSTDTTWEAIQLSKGTSRTTVGYYFEKPSIDIYGKECYMFIDFSKEKPVYIITAAPFYTNTKETYKEEITIPDYYMSVITKDGITIPHNLNNEYKRISHDFLTRIDDYEELLPFEEYDE